MARFKPFDTVFVPEKAILVGVDLGSSEWPLEDSMAELERLAQTDGAEVVASLTQRLDKPVSRTFIGSGKTEELVHLVKSLDADVVIFDDELTPSQQSNLEKIVGSPVKIIDRTALILDIFGVHATTHEGRLQVQLAQLQYLYPRLRGMWSHLVGEQTRGGIGSRFGQGESQLEVDRRLIRKRMTTLRSELARLDTRRSTQSKARWESGVYRVAMAGYTNAGKSTLLNRLSGSDVYAKDELFATLDPTTRALDLDEGRKFTLTDTVGFIQKLPTTLIESFKSTLAEVKNADLVLRVMDASDPNLSRELRTVDSILKQIGVGDTPYLIVLNKVYLILSEKVDELRAQYPGCLFVSAAYGSGIDELLFEISRKASEGDSILTVRITYSKGFLMKMAHERCRVIRETYENEGLLITVSASKRMQAMLLPYSVGITNDQASSEAQCQ